MILTATVLLILSMLLLIVDRSIPNRLHLKKIAIAGTCASLFLFVVGIANILLEQKSKPDTTITSTSSENISIDLSPKIDASAARGETAGSYALSSEPSEREESPVILSAAAFSGEEPTSASSPVQPRATAPVIAEPARREASAAAPEMVFVRGSSTGQKLERCMPNQDCTPPKFFTSYISPVPFDAPVEFSHAEGPKTHNRNNQVWYWKKIAESQPCTSAQRALGPEYEKACNVPIGGILYVTHPFRIIGAPE
jgi:hypothetical protein